MILRCTEILRGNRERGQRHTWFRNWQKMVCLHVTERVLLQPIFTAGKAHSDILLSLEMRAQCSLQLMPSRCSKACTVQNYEFIWLQQLDWKLGMDPKSKVLCTFHYHECACVYTYLVSSQLLKKYDRLMSPIKTVSANILVPLNFCLFFSKAEKWK